MSAGVIAASRVRGAAMSAYAIDTLSHSPLAYWRLNDAVNSAVALDSSGNGHDGNAIQGAHGFGTMTYQVPSLIPGDPDKCIDFPGTGSLIENCIDITSAAWMSGIKGWDMLVNMDALGVSVFDRDEETFRSWQFNMYSNGLGLVWWGSGGSGPFFLSPPNGTLVTGTTYHIGAMLDGSGVWRLYVNGAVLASSSAGQSLYNSGSVLRIGAHANWSAASRVDGRIDEVAVYSTALTTAEMLARKTLAGL